jgi:hypothetical protein
VLGCEVVSLGKKILCALVVPVVLIIVCLGIRRGGPSPVLGTCFIAAMGSSNLVLTFFVTNNTPRPVVLEHPFVIRQKEPGNGEYHFEVWGDLNETTNLMPGGVATLIASLSGSEQRIEFLFSYFWRAGALERALSVPIGRVAKKCRPNKVTYWLWGRGLMDGQCRRTFQRFWVPNPLPAANIRRPFCNWRVGEICCSFASSGLGCPAAVAEGGR